MPADTNLLPATTATDIISGFTGVVTDNIAVVLALLGFAWGVSFVVARINRAKKGKL